VREARAQGNRNPHPYESELTQQSTGALTQQVQTKLPILKEVRTYETWERKRIMSKESRSTKQTAMTGESTKQRQAMPYILGHQRGNGSCRNRRNLKTASRSVGHHREDKDAASQSGSSACKGQRDHADGNWCRNAEI